MKIVRQEDARNLQQTAIELRSRIGHDVPAPDRMPGSGLLPADYWHGRAVLLPPRSRANALRIASIGLTRWAAAFDELAERIEETISLMERMADDANARREFDARTPA